MTAQPAALEAWLDETSASEGVTEVLTVLGRTCAMISDVVAGGAQHSGVVNVQDEEQKKLDLITNDMLTDALMACPLVAGVASEEMDTVQPAANPHGEWLVLFDPLDGSSNIDINAPVGTIFSILKSPSATPTEADFLQPGRDQLASGYVLYGAQTMLVLTVGKGVVGFTLAPDGRWLLTHETVTIPADCKEFAINMSNRRHWAEGVQRYIDGCLQGAEGPRGKNFNMRWVAAMVADVHRVLCAAGCSSIRGTSASRTSPASCASCTRAIRWRC